MNDSTTLDEVISCAAFKGFGPLLFPASLSVKDRLLPLSEASRLFTQHEHVDTQELLLVLNSMQRLCRRGKKIFFDIYSDQEKQNDPAKAATGLFFFRGVRGGPFAVIVPGCGEYVASLPESFPCALELCRPGFNVFCLHYRPGAAQICEDLAAAITFIFAHAAELGIMTEAYSLWGSSAGGDAAAYLASYGPHAFGGANLPRAASLILQHCDHANYTRREPPTFSCAGADDSEALLKTMRSRTDKLRSCGIDAEFHVYPGVSGGFGLGTGTAAEGWLQSAAAFWKRHLTPGARRCLRRRPAVRPLDHIK